MIIALLGKIKGESAVLAHLVPCVWVTATGINLKGILTRLLIEKRKFVLYDGPVILDENGKLVTTRDIDAMLLEVLNNCYQEDRETFSVDITSTDNLDQFYHCFWTFRKTSAIQATNQVIKNRCRYCQPVEDSRIC